MTETFSQFFKKLKRQEKILVVAFAVFIGFNIYFHLVYKPLSRGIKYYAKQSEKAVLRVEETKTKFPKTEKQKDKIGALNEECKRYLAEIDEIQKRLPSKANAAQLMSEFSRQAKDVRLISLRQKVDETKEYSRLFIEVRFDADYKQTVNYIKKMEAVSPFLKIEEIELLGDLPKEKEGNDRMVFSTLLTDTPVVQPLIIEEVEEITGDTRNIFASKVKKDLQAQKKKLELQGITYNIDNPTAIINGDIVKIDSQIEGFTIKQILPEQVILNDGIQDYMLEVAR